MKDLASVIAFILAAYTSIPVLAPTKTPCVVACDTAFDTCLSACDETKECATRCMAKHLECKADCGGTSVRPGAAPLLWYCHGYIGPCKDNGNEDENTFGRCEHGFGKGTTEAKARADSITNCETALNTNGGPFVCAKATPRLYCEKEKRQ